LNASGDAQDATSLHDYLTILRRQRWVILQAALILPIIAILYSLHETPVYQASATVLLSRSDLSDQLNNIQNANANSSTLIPTQAAVARVPEVARRAITQLGLNGMTPGKFLKHSSVVQKPGADTLGFKFSSTDPALAQRAATAYAQQYVAYRHALDTAGIVSARNEVEARIQQLGAQGDSKSALYQTLVERDQQLQTMAALQTSNATVVQTAQSAGKVSPRPTRNAVLAFVLGLMLGIGLAFLRETLDTRVRTAHEISERLGLPLLGRVPEPPKHLRTEDRLVMLAEPGAASAEAFRVLRTNLEFSTLGHSVKSVLITSAVEREGKSTTIANLAIALARGGQNVTLVDLDLRRPYIEKFFGMEDKPGVTQVALGRASLDEALVEIPLAPIEPSPHLRSHYDLSGSAELNGKASLGTLTVLAAGPIPPDPGEFVSSVALSQVLEDLEHRSDIVLVDTPPLLHVGDAMVLSAKVDALLLATRMERVRRPMLGEVTRLLANAPTRLLGFIVTGAEAEQGYGYGYGYGYYRYGYGYGYEPRAESGKRTPAEKTDVAERA
jgi:succinoglycan biosynthesis transport protein ExoP